MQIILNTRLQIIIICGQVEKVMIKEHGTTVQILFPNA